MLGCRLEEERGCGARGAGPGRGACIPIPDERATETWPDVSNMVFVNRQ